MNMRLLLAGVVALISTNAVAALHVVVIEGLPGEPVYAAQFAAETNAIRSAALKLTDDSHLHVLTGAAATQLEVRKLFKSLATSAARDDQLALYLIGHGSFDGTTYKFNLPGPDITGAELAALLNACPARDQLVVATGSSSGALQELLKNATRVVLTATRSGAERNATRFGTEFAAALADSAADTDKNGSLSAQEAFEFAARGVKSFYEQEVRLASEHAQLVGERAARFTVARVGAAVSATSSPEKDRINRELDALRLRKTDLPEAEYNTKLEALLLQLATLDEAAAKPPEAPAAGAPTP